MLGLRVTLFRSRQPPLCGHRCFRSTSAPAQSGFEPSRRRLFQLSGALGDRPRVLRAVNATAAAHVELPYPERLAGCTCWLKNQVTRATKTLAASRAGKAPVAGKKIGPIEFSHRPHRRRLSQCGRWR